MFKRGAFELDAVVHPVAIKYNKIFVDAFWNSRWVGLGTELCSVMAMVVVAVVYSRPPSGVTAVQQVQKG